MKYKFKAGDLVQFKTQVGYFESFQIIARGYLEGDLDKQNIYNLQNSTSRMVQVCEDLLIKYENIKGRNSGMIK